MLDWCYLHEKPLPIDPEEIARLVRMRTHSDCIAVVLREYFKKTKDGWISLRVLEEIARVGVKSDKAAESAKARWSKVKYANALQAQSEGNATHNTLHKTQDTLHKKNTVAPPDGVTDSVWQDFKTLRKVKKAPITNAALDGIQREAAKAGWSMESALKECCTRGWVGFKAEWVAKTAPDKPQYDPDSRAAIEAEGIERGIGPWDEGMEQWHVYKAKVRGKPEAAPNFAQLLALAKRKAA
jgi:uncharacterized protein YdaU (DUF1376 family)